ncbi:hypothetical protein Leryth_013199 [Lithospermum erythrorhizon]|nr:hypothetical protein Leryth_013199 [Lithospermum erythrorhizon]
MGTTFSGLNNNDENVAASVGLSDLPESCVALILSYLDPSDICKLALVNSTFRRASSADSVWEKRLPENHEVLLKKVHQCQEHHQNLYKKMIFARLCRPIRFNDDTKVMVIVREFWIENNGGFCMAISWKGLKITGIDDGRRWIHISSDESR